MLGAIVIVVGAFNPTVAQVRAQFEAWSKGGLWRTFAAAQPIEVLESQLLEKATGLVEGAQVRGRGCVDDDQTGCCEQGPIGSLW